MMMTEDHVRMILDTSHKVAGETTETNSVFSSGSIGEDRKVSGRYCVNLLALTGALHNIIHGLGFAGHDDQDDNYHQVQASQIKLGKVNFK